MASDGAAVATGEIAQPSKMAISAAVGTAATCQGQTRLVFTARPFVDIGTDDAKTRRLSQAETSNYCEMSEI
jgi:hypothetical protein